MKLIFLTLITVKLLFCNAEPAMQDSVDKVDNIKQSLLSAAFLPVEAQKAILSAFGVGLTASGQLECNIFGGKISCADIPRKSDYAAYCVGATKEVDCAFKGAAVREVKVDPSRELGKRIKESGFGNCDQCVIAVHNFWCGQTLPTCGTFDKIVNTILPIVQKVASGKGKPQVVLEDAFPEILEAFSLGLPCREMCKLITDNCNCGKPTTFGAAYLMLEKSDKLETGISRNISLITAKKLFRSLWDEPICNAFAPMKTEGFIGVCELPMDSVPGDSCLWCKSSRGGPKGIEIQLVSQLAESISEMLESGLGKVFDIIGGGFTNPQEEPPISKEHQTENSPSSRSSHSITGIVFMWIFSLLLVGGLAAGAMYAYFFYFSRDRPDRSQYLDLQAMGYNPPEM